MTLPIRGMSTIIVILQLVRAVLLRHEMVKMVILGSQNWIFQDKLSSYLPAFQFGPDISHYCASQIIKRDPLPTLLFAVIIPPAR